MENRIKGSNGSIIFESKPDRRIEEKLEFLNKNKMFKKVLIAEDFDSINIALIQTLETLGIENIQYAKYCDDALDKIKMAVKENDPFQLIISDLSFAADYKKVKITSGEKLIEEILKIQNDIYILVYSVEDKSFVIKGLFDKLDIDGYVHKGRNSLSHLKTAIETILYDKKFISPELTHVLLDKSGNEISEFDITLLKHLAQGILVDEMEGIFKKLNIRPNSKSAIEKRLSRIKDYFKANNNIQLVAITKDLGII